MIANASNRAIRRSLVLALVVSLNLNTSLCFSFIQPVRHSSRDLFTIEVIVQPSLEFFHAKTQTPEGLQLLQTQIKLAHKRTDAELRQEQEAVSSVKKIISAIGNQSESDFAAELEKTEPLIVILHGAGLDEVDKHLMRLFFQSTDVQTKLRLLQTRELMFKRGGSLAANGMDEAEAFVDPSGKTPTAEEAIARVKSNLERWHRRALAYASAFIADHPDANETNRKLVKKGIVEEINDDIYNPLLRAVDRIEYLIKTGKINPGGVHIKLSRTGLAPVVHIQDRRARIGFLPMKGDPWQVGHIFVMLEAMAEERLDKVVIMVDNSDPERKPNLSSLTIREPITLELLKVLEPLVEYTPIAKEEENLRTADGETSIFRLMEFNRSIPMHWFYMVGSDHRRWEFEKNGKMNPDTAKKLQSHKETRLDRYAGEELGIIFIERAGEEFVNGEMEQLRIKSGITGISKIHQPMDTSSTRVRKDKHWWTVPSDVLEMAKVIGFWAAEAASEIVLSTSQAAGVAYDVRLKTAA